MWFPSSQALPRTARSIVTKKPMLAIVMVVVASSSSGLQSAQPAPLSLKDASELHCAFTLYATGTWKNDDAVAQVRPSTLSVAFKDIDVENGFATAVGVFGPSTIIVRLASGSLHLMQIAAAGALYVTTVFEKEVRGGRLKAVHTRHEYTDVSLPGFTSRPEQYYGDCEVRQKPSSVENP